MTNEQIDKLLEALAKMAGIWTQFDSGIQAVLDEQPTEVRHD